MTDDEIKEFASHVGKDSIQLFGYTSTSSSQQQAKTFAWQNETTGHSKVLFRIEWNNYSDHYYLNAGAYDYEEETVLMDSTRVYVREVREILNDEDEKEHTLIVLASNYN